MPYHLATPALSLVELCSSTSRIINQERRGEKLFLKSLRKTTNTIAHNMASLQKTCSPRFAPRLCFVRPRTLRAVPLLHAPAHVSPSVPRAYSEKQSETYNPKFAPRKENPGEAGVKVHTCEKLLCSADAANGGSAVGALALRDRLAILRQALSRVLHRLLGLALHAIRFDSHSFSYLSAL